VQLVVAAQASGALCDCGIVAAAALGKRASGFDVAVNFADGVLTLVVSLP
jgi:hypothetical protein